MASLETSGLWEDPVFGFDGAEILSPEGPFEFGLMLEWTIPISGRLGVERDLASAAYEAELRRVVEAEWAIRMQVREAWAHWSEALLRQELLGNFVTDTQRVVELTDRLEEAGEFTRVEARLIRGQLASARLEAAGAALAVQAASSELYELIGLWPGGSLELLPELSSPAGSEQEVDIDRLITSNLSLAVSRAEYQAAEEALRLEIRKQYPDLTIGAGYGNEDDDRLLLGLSIPIPALNGNRAGIAAAEAKRDQARLRAESQFEELSRRFLLARNKLSITSAQRESFETVLVPLLDQQLGEIERLMDLGQVDALLLLESLTGRLDAKSKLLDLRLSEVRASIEVESLLGPTIPGEPAPVDEPSTESLSVETHLTIDQPEAGSTSGGREVKSK